MKCRKIQINISLLLYGELNKKEQKAVSDHIATCKKCQKAYASYQKTMRLLNRWPEQPTGNRIFSQIIEHTKPEILTPEELAAYLRVSPADILANIETIPHIRIGEFIRFHRATIIQWLMKSRQLKETEQSDELTDWKFLINRAHNNKEEIWH